MPPIYRRWIDIEPDSIRMTRRLAPFPCRSVSARSSMPVGARFELTRIGAWNSAEVEVSSEYAFPLLFVTERG